MRKSVKLNFLYQSAYQILMVISPLITSPYISRVLGADNLGIYSYCYSVAYYFGIFAILGISNYGNRSIAKINRDSKEERSQLFCEIFGMQLLTSSVVIAAYLVYIVIFANDYRVNSLIELLYILSVCLDISWFFFGIEEFKTTTFRSFIIRILTIVSILLFVKNSNDLNVYTAIMAGGNLLSSLSLWICLPKYIKFTKPYLKSIVNHIKPNVVLFIPVVSLALFHYMDKVMLGSYSTMDELGYYSNADKVINIPMGLITGLGTVMLPRISSLSAENNWKSINDYIGNSIVFSMWISSAMCFGIMAVVKDFVPLFFGDGFEKCIDLLLILAPVILIKSWSHVFRMQFLIPLGKDKEFNISVIIAALINIIFNRVFIPQLGSIGAVIGTLIAETCVALLYTWFARRDIKIKKSVLLTIVFLIAGLIMYATLGVLESHLKIESHIIRLLIELIFGVGIYTIITFTLMYIMRYDAFMSIISRSTYKNTK